MNTSIPATEIARKRTHMDRVVKARVTKTHATYGQVSLDRELHPAVRTTNNSERRFRRLDIPPLPGSSLAKKPLDARFARQKSTWRSILFGFLEQEEEDERYLDQQEKFKQRDVRMGNTPISPPLMKYEDMDCTYDTMDPRAAFNMSGGVFGCPHGAFSTSTSSNNTFSSSSGSGGTMLTFGASTFASSMGFQSSAAAFNGSTGSATAGGNTPSSPEITMSDAPDASTDKIAAAPLASIAPVPASPSSQPPKPLTMAPVAPLQFTGLGYLPSKPLPSEKAPAPRKAPTAHGQDTAKPPSKPQQTEPAENAKAQVSLPPNADADTPSESSRAKIALKTRSTAPQQEPKDAPRGEVELGMGAFAPTKIQTSDALVSAFSNPYFKIFFADEMETLKTCLGAKKEIRGSHLVFLGRSLKWVMDGQKAGWFDCDIDLEADVADWRGKLNIFMETLEKVNTPDATGIAADTQAKIKKVFVIFGGVEKLNEETRLSEETG